jgi:hypothetical protein
MGVCVGALLTKSAPYEDLHSRFAHPGEMELADMLVHGRLARLSNSDYQSRLALVQWVRLSKSDICRTCRGGVSKVA